MTRDAKILLQSAVWTLLGLGFMWAWVINDNSDYAVAGILCFGLSDQIGKGR